MLLPLPPPVLFEFTGGLWRKLLVYIECGRPVIANGIVRGGGID